MNARSYYLTNAEVETLMKCIQHQFDYEIEALNDDDFEHPKNRIVDFKSLFEVRNKLKSNI